MILIIVICGLPGVGKITLARDLAPLINAVILSSDKIRKELVPKPTYTRQEVKLIYDVMMLLAKYLYNAGINCIIDATFNKQDSRSELKKKLMIPEEKLCIVECVCPEDIITSRLKSRRNDYSDANFSIYERMKKTYEPILEDHIVVDTCQFSSETNAKEIAFQLKRKINGDTNY
jgi:predicted kinase